MSDLPPCYAVLYPKLVEIAKRYGYALAIHGSMTRDFDLIAVPWTVEASDHFPMIEEMKHEVRAVYSHHEIDYLILNGNFTNKPHGRVSYSLHLTNNGSDGPYIDISVMPRFPDGHPDPVNF